MVLVADRNEAPPLLFLHPVCAGCRCCLLEVLLQLLLLVQQSRPHWIVLMLLDRWCAHVCCCCSCCVCMPLLPGLWQVYHLPDRLHAREATSTSGRGSQQLLHAGCRDLLQLLMGV